MALLPRALYPTLAQCRYLNQASLGLISQPAVEQMRLFLDDVAQHGNLHMTCAVQWLVLAASNRLCRYCACCGGAGSTD
jgi:hypothetical protein